MAQPRYGNVLAAVEDGRASNVYYKLTQLEKLHQSLITNAAALQAAIVTSTGVSTLEAKQEFSLALHTLRDRYEELDPHKELDEEYALASGRDADKVKKPIGMIVIKTSSHTPCFSLIAPLSASITAGNCSVIQLDPSLEQVNTVIKQTLDASLDPDSFVITTDSPPDSVYGHSTASVIQTGESQASSGYLDIVSTPSRPVIAIVDRSANFEEAAKYLTEARFGFRGRSPYAPDLVLVNEFVKKDLLQALVRQTLAIDGDAASTNEKRKHGIPPGFSDNSHIVTQTSSGSIIETPREGFGSKMSEPHLIVQSMTSLDDAIDYVSSQSNGPLLAAYTFSSPSVAKYLSQFVSADVTFANHIPAELLVGPTFPVNHPIVNASTRYPTSLFTTAAPAFIKPTETSKALGKAGLTASAADRQAGLQALFQSATAKLPVGRKRPKQLTVSFGFFEHAFVLHFGVYFFTALGLLGGGAWWLRRLWLARR